VRFEVIGMLSMIGHEEHNATNIRIFIPFNTMRELFPLKGDNSQEGNAISFINYQPRTFDCPASVGNGERVRPLR
jgi:hypothetical protein